MGHGRAKRGHHQAQESRSACGSAAWSLLAERGVTMAEYEVWFDTAPDRYRRWTLAVDGRVATLTLKVDENGGLVPGYELKMNSYDLGVDIELADAVQRLRFEHPTVRAVVVTGGLERMF